MAEMMMFQPGLAFMDAYNKGRSNSLQKLAMTDPNQRKSALADLAGIDPNAARTLQSDFDEKDKADFADWAGTLVKVAPELQPKVYQAGVARFGDKFRRMGIEPPQDYKQALPAIQQWAGITPQQAPAKVQEAQWFAKQIGLDPAKDPQGYAEFMRQAAGYGGKGPKMSVAPDGTPYDAENFRVFRDGKWIDISPGAMGGQTPPQNDGQGSGQPISLEQINQIGARMRRDGGSVEEVNAWKEQQYALWELANGMGNSGAIGSTAGQAPPPVAASPAGPAAGASTVTPPAAIGQGRPLFAKPGWRLATAQEKKAMGIPANVPAQIGPDGKIDPISLPGGDKSASIANETTIRKEFAAQVKPYQDVISAYKRVETAASSPTAAGDLSMIFAYMKMLDPGSVVREGEFANAQNAAGVPDQVLNLYNRIRTGQRLNPQQRADFLKQARGLKINAETSYKEYERQYAEIAKQYEIPIERIVVGPSVTPRGGTIDLNSPDPLGILK